MENKVSKKGFTLIEILLIIVAIGIFVTIVILIINSAYKGGIVSATLQDPSIRSAQFE